MSIVIPCHDDVDTLPKTLAGIAAQEASIDRIEVVVVDNNSTLNFLEDLHREWSSRLTLTVIHRPSLSHPFALSSARNLALRTITNPWVLSLDADCIPGQSYFRAILAEIEGCGSGGAACFTGERAFIAADALTPETILGNNRCLESAPRVRSVSNYELLEDRRLPGMRELPLAEHPWAYMHGANFLYPSAAARAIGGHDEAFDGHWGYEDADFAFRLITAGGCEPRFVEGMRVYHQEPADPGAYTMSRRLDKRANPNWGRVCATIPGFEDFKRGQYRALGIAATF